MKKLYKSAPPNVLTVYAASFPEHDWNDFRNHAATGQSPGDDYRQIKQLLVDDQGGLCGYCEQNIGSSDANHQRIEHYHPKSDTANPAINWALHWSNILVVCMGGETEGETHPLPANLSCDAHKNHLLNGLNPASIAATLAEQLNPFTLPSFPCLFDFDLRTGALLPDTAACKQVDQEQGFSENTTLTQVQKNIQSLNLNCDRLCQNRLMVRNAYNREVKLAREANDRDFQRNLAQRWFSNRWPSFFTTRRILLGQAAEAYLQQIPFHG